MRCNIHSSIHWFLSKCVFVCVCAFVTAECFELFHDSFTACVQTLAVNYGGETRRENIYIDATESVQWTKTKGLNSVYIYVEQYTKKMDRKKNKTKTEKSERKKIESMNKSKNEGRKAHAHLKIHAKSLIACRFNVKVKRNHYIYKFNQLSEICMHLFVESMFIAEAWCSCVAFQWRPIPQHL